MTEVRQGIRSVLAAHGKLGVAIGELADDQDLYDAGLTSHTTVSLMLALEDEFGVEFPDEFLHRGTFATITSIEAAINEAKV